MSFENIEANCLIYIIVARSPAYYIPKWTPTPIARIRIELWYHFDYFRMSLDYNNAPWEILDLYRVPFITFSCAVEQSLLRIHSAVYSAPHTFRRLLCPTHIPQFTLLRIHSEDYSAQHTFHSLLCCAYIPQLTLLRIDFATYSAAHAFCSLLCCK